MVYFDTQIYQNKKYLLHLVYSKSMTENKYILFSNYSGIYEYYTISFSYPL